MNAIKKSVGEKTRALILGKRGSKCSGSGLRKQRQLRDIAKSAKVATGATYYYFPTRKPSVAAYTTTFKVTHEAKVRELVLGTTDLRERLELLSIRN